MPIFENNGKKQNVQDAHVGKYMELYPDATTVMERDGKKYRVKAKDYNTFLGDTLQAPKMESAPQPAPQVEAEPKQGFFTGVKAQIADTAKQAMQKPRGGENGDTFTADELGIAEGKGKVEAEPTSVTTATEEVAAPVKTGASAAVPGERAWWQNAAKIMGKEEAKPQMYGPMTKELMEEQRMLAEGRSIPQADIEAALPQANASMLQKMHDGATMQGAFDRAYGAAKGVYYADEAERLTKGLLDEYSAERAKRLSQVEKDVENYNSARRWAVSNPYATDAYSEVAYRSNATKLRNADELGMMEEFAKDAKKRLLADENLKAKAEENAELLGMPVERYINEVAVPIMQERMYSEWLAPQEERAKRNYNGLAAAAEGSLIGTLLGATRTDTEKYLSQVGQEAWRRNASLLGRAAAAAGSMFLDLPVFMGAGSLASVPAKAVGGQVFKQLAKNETKRLVARGVAEGAAQRYANYAVRNGLKNRILLNLSTAPLQSGLTFGMFDAGKAALNMSLNGEWDWGELGKSAVGGTLMGGALGATGAVGGGLTHGLTGATKAAAKVAEFGVENAVFTEGGRLIGKLHGQQPENGWLEDYVESGATLLMIKAPNIVKNVSAIKGDKEASEVFAFNRLEREQLGKYGEDLNSVLESLLPKSGRLYEDRLKINEGTFTEEYRRVMSDPEVSMTTKAKLMGIVEGKMMPAPRVVDAKIEGNRVMTYDPMGRLVEVKEYATKTKAEAEYKKAADKAEIESIAVMEDVYMRIKGYEADELTVKEWLAKNPKVTMERVAEIVAKNSAGEKLTEAEQKILESLRQARREGLNDVRHLNDVLAWLDVDPYDVMSGLDKPIDKRTERENRAVRAYTDVLFREVKDKIQEPYRRGEAQRAADDVWRAANNVRWANEDVKLLADRIYESDRSVDETANDGMVYTTTTPSGEKIIITGGKVVLDNEGYIDVNQSEDLVAMFPDGQKKPVRPGDLREKVEVSNAEEIKAVKREEIEQEIAAENGWKPIEVGAEYDVVFDGDAFRVKVEGRDENGDVIISGEGASMAVPESFLQDAMKQAEALKAESGKALQTESGEVKGENGAAPVVEGQKGENAVEPVGEVAAPVVEAPKTALEQIPRNEKNVPLYEQVDSELAWDGVVEEAGGNEETAMVAVNSMVEDKKKALAAAEKAKAKAGVTIAEKIAAENERVANIEKAKADIAKWEEIAGVKAKRALAAEAESKRVADEAAAKQRAEEERLRAEREEAERAEREALNGVPDMVDDKPQDARARGYRRVNGHKVDRQEPVQGLMGKEIAVKFSDSSIPTGRIAVIEAEQLQPSHIQGQRNPLHFIDEAQPKERNDAASVLSARKIAENVRPEEITSSVTAYTGAPTVNTRGEAVQGNNRSAALRLMWENNPEQAAKYKQYLMDHAAEFGLNAEDVAAMKSPVLVNMLDVSDADAITLGQYVAQDTESGGTERIKPKNVMQKMGGDMRSFANKLLASNNEEASFAELVDANGVEVLKWMAQKGYITPTQYKSAFDSKGNLTAEVKNDLRDVMYQSIFKGGSTQLEEMFNALPAKAQKAILATAFRDYDSPSGERMNGEVQNSIRAYYALARDAAFANAKNYKEAKEAAMMWARQYQLDDVSGESFLPSENFSNFAIELAIVYKGWTQRNLQNHFNNIYDLVQGAKEASLFEEADNTPRTLKEAIKETFNIDYNGQSNSNSLAIDSKDGQARKRGGNGDIATGERIEGGERPADSTGRARGNGEVSSPEIPNNQIPGLKGYTTDEVLNLTKGHITDILGGDISIVDMRVIGSRSNGTNSENSDLDVLVEFDGDISEDAFFNAVNGEDALYIDGVRVDINPITKEKSGTIEQWMNRNAGYSKIEGGNAPGMKRIPTTLQEIDNAVVEETQAPVVESAPVAEVETPQATNEMQEAEAPGQSGVAATLIKGAKWENTGEPDKIKSSRKKGDSHDITWYIGKKKYGSTTAERDLLVILAEDYGGDLNAVWNAYEQGKVLLGANEAAILKKLIETNTSAAELQQGVLELDRENPAFERATENVRKKLEATGVKVKVLTKKEAESELARLEKAQRQVVNSRMSKLDKVSRAIMNWLKNNTRDRRFEIELPVATQRKIRKEMGRDFDTHSITANSVAHSKKNHGVGGEKNTTTSIPLRDKDFALIPYIMTAPDNVIRGSYSTDGSESVRFYKNLSNGYVVVVEKEQKNSPDDMETITMWAELSANVPNARNMRPSSTTSVTVTISPDDVAKIRKDAENAILFDTKVEKMVYGGNSNQEIFVSNAQRAVEGIKQEKATPEQWIAMLKKNGGLKAGEEAWLGLEEWLTEKGKVKGENGKDVSLTKQEVLDFVNENAIKIEEVRYSQFGYGMLDEAAKKLEAETKEIGWNAMQEKYPGIEDFFEYYNGEVLWNTTMASIGEYEDFVLDNKIVYANPTDNAINESRESYTTEGLERKREIALVVPTVEPYNQHDEIHFGDAGNGRAVAWVRFGETTDSEGNRVLVIDEIQSKRHQDGREKGYKSQADKIPVTMEELTFGEYNGLTTVSLRGERFFFKSSTSKDEILDIINKRIADGQLGAANSLVPDAPFEKNWHELAMKRMLRLAAEEGFDKVAWTTGEQQAERYNIAKVVSHIECEKVGKNGNKSFSMGLDYKFIVDPNGIVVSSKDEYIGKSLADIVGKPLANKMLEMQEGDTISGDGLRIGGEGMKGFYDRMLPSFVQKYTKKWGAKVGTVEMPSLEQNNVMHSVDVTPEMKESVMEGQTMFLRTPDGTTYGWAVNGEIYLTPEGLNPNTPIHEYTHLWAAALQKSNPKLWSEVVEAMKLSPVWNEVMADENYTDIHGDDNRVASEVLSRLSGNEGYRRYMEQAEKEIAAERDIVGKVQKKGILNRIRNAVSRFWNWLKGKLGSKAKAGDGTEAKAEPWDVFVNKSLKDFDEGVNPNVKESPLEKMVNKVDRDGNPIGDGSWHNSYKVDEVALSYPNISYKVDESASTESVYVTYTNNDPKYPENERPKVTVRYSNHDSNAVKFGDQLRGHVFDESTPVGKRMAERQTNILLTRLGLKKAVPVYGKYIPNRMVSNREIEQGIYEETDKTIQEMYDLPIGTDISQYKGKVAKGSRYLIEGDEVERGQIKDYKFVDVSKKEPVEEYVVGNNANFVSTYKTKDGKDIEYTSERAEGYGIQGGGTGNSYDGTGNSILQRQTDTGVPGANSGLNADKGEFCVVERVFTENGAFNFTSGEKIESADDVAYIFSALEDAAKEHSFVVYVKDGKPTVIELGMGSFNATMVDIPTASLAYSRINPDHVYFVHNHPSGNLVCSGEDVAMLRVFEDMSDVPVTGVIINLKTGKYGTFDTERHSAIGEKRVPENEERLTVHTLDKQIFAPDYDPMAQPLVRSSQDVAQFLNSQRMGDRPKVSFLILSRANRIIGNIHTPFTDITTDTEAVARYINERVIQFGGENAILYGDFAISMDESRGFRLLQGAMERFGKTKLLDVVHVEGNFTKSAIDLGLLYEPEMEYNVAKENRERFDSPEQDIPVEEVQTQPMTFAEKITNSVLEASAKNKENLALRSDALRMYGRDVANVLKLMGKQREYDKSTVDQLVKLAKMYFKDAQLLGGLTPYQVGRVMTRLNNAVGKRDITDDANELVNILVDAHNKELEKMLEKQAKTKAKKVNASGVEVIGKLDKEGQLLLEEYNTGKELDLESIDDKIIDLQNEAADASGNVEGESGDPDAERTREIAARIRGLELAREYREEILKKLDEIKGLEQELKSAEQDAKDGAMDRAAYKEFRRATERAILESKLEMVDAYHGLIHGLGGDISSSAKRAKLFQQQQIDHVKEIQHNANSDLLGHPAEAQGETPDKWNSSVPRLFMSAMPTFQTMLKFFGEKAADGRGYLYERFIPQHTQASHNEYIGKTEAREKMREKLTEIFGKKTSIENFLDMSRKDGAVLEYQEGGQKKTIDLTRGQVLYLYMINKMADGQMKLSRMGITDADVLKMAKELPEEMVRFADWVQEDFLTELREKYNKVHERMFGAPMAAIESYFPIKINKRSRGEKIEPGMNAEDKPSTVTGSVIKRTKNAVAIDLSADAMQVLLGHIDDMENWAAWAEFRRDVKSLLNYRHFQNQVKGMESLRYGSGEKLWKNFVDVANIAAGSFKPSSTAADRAVRNIAKGVVSSKIAFRYFTAVKQILSTPAFWSEVDFGKMMNAYLHQKEAWDWAMKNLPGFSKRWEGRASGNEILLESDADWKVWQNRAVQWLSKEGMRANAFIDALTVATGAKAVFETKYEMFKKAGYSEERAREKALNRAAEAYNESQQSSESAYLSPLQAEATFVSSVLTAYRNSPFGYNRKMATAIANLKKKMKKGFKQESIEYMIKQLMRDGLNEEQAKKFAKSTYRRSVARDAADVALYEFFLNYVWVLGPSLIYILGGDDDEKKKELNVEALIDGAMGGLGNLPAGETLTGAIKAIAEGDVSNFKLPQAVAMQDMETIADLMQTDPVRAAGEVLNILVAMGVGVNPQTFTDMFVALADTEDWSDPREIAMLVLRLINAPNSKLELLEADEAMENYGANIEEITREYAEYQKSKRAPLSGWLYSDESEQKAIERYEKRFKKILDERFESIVENTDEYDMWYENSDPQMKAKLAKLRQKFQEGDKETTMEKLDSIDVTKKVLFGSGYDEVNTVYYELSTAEDEDMAMMIDTKLKELQPMMDEYKKLRGDEREAYREKNLEQIQFYNRLNAHKNNVNNLKGAMKKKPEEAQEKMEKIRKIRTKAIDLINDYNE